MKENVIGDEILQIRIVSFSDKYEGYRLVGYSEVDNISEVFKTLHYMKINEIPLLINISNVIDDDNEEYFINDIGMVFPSTDCEIIPHIVVYIEEC